MMPASARGVSTTRSAPNLSTSPLVVRKTPPSLPTSSPSTITRWSASISSTSALLMASTMLRWDNSVPLTVHQLGALAGNARWCLLVHVGEHVAGPRSLGLGRELQGALDLLAQLIAPFGLLLGVPQADRGQVLLHALDRVARLGFLV